MGYQPAHRIQCEYFIHSSLHKQNY